MHSNYNDCHLNRAEDWRTIIRLRTIHGKHIIIDYASPTFVIIGGRGECETFLDPSGHCFS
jgi:hypothetical protein